MSILQDCINPVFLFFSLRTYFPTGLVPVTALIKITLLFLVHHMITSLLLICVTLIMFFFCEFLVPLNRPFLGTPSAFARFHATLLPALSDVICRPHKQVPSENIL